MKITAIIAEYNPFHNGHLKQLRKAKRETKPDALVVLMSGSFTERGDLCIVDKYTRAQWAIEAGADLVLELPTVYSLQTASGFAQGAIKTLSMLGDFTLSFGMETDELENVSMAAEFLQSESHDVSNMIKGFLSEGYSVAKSRTMAVGTLRPDIANMLQSPNNILAVEYIKAATACANNISFHSVQRKADDGKKYLSSTKIRSLLFEGGDISAFVPEFVKIDNIIDPKKYSAVSTYSMKMMSAPQLAEIANIYEGMENRISKSSFNTFEEFLQMTSKRYTRSTIKRIAASSTVGLTKDMVALAQSLPPYTTVLAARNSKKKALFALLASSEGYFYFKPSDCQKDSPVRPLIDLDLKAYKIQNLCKACDQPRS